MSLIQSLACPNCGYPFPTTIVPGSIIQCAACHSTFSMPATLTPEPDLGNLLLAADMRGPEIPGWKSYSWVKAEFTQYNGIAEWRVTMAPEPNHQTDFLLCTPGILDDFDTCATFRFLSGDEKNYFAGFDLRAGEDGCYQVVIDSGGRFRIGYYEKGEWGDNLVTWGEHPSLRSGLGQPNTLRVLLRGTQMRVYLNGVLAVSLHDTRFNAGKMRVVSSPYDQQMVLAVSNVQIREVRPA